MPRVIFEHVNHQIIFKVVLLSNKDVEKQKLNNSFSNEWRALFSACCSSLVIERYCSAKNIAAYLCMRRISFDHHHHHHHGRMKGTTAKKWRS